jgi:hypothetical protein
MKGYASFEVFTAYEQKLLERATYLVGSIPDNFLPNDYLRCHELARAVGFFMHLPHQDGAYGSVEHTWLWTRPLVRLEDGQQPPVILDVYAVGRLPMVQLVDYSSSGPMQRTIYKYPRNIPDVNQKIVDQLIAFFEKNAALTDLLIQSLR